MSKMASDNQNKGFFSADGNETKILQNIHEAKAQAKSWPDLSYCDIMAQHGSLTD